jgi:pyruvate dehydrogenase E2 component (dihydrolipoamide acetyltransferase)
VDEGGAVKKGEPLVDIETDKANTTYDAQEDGVLAAIVAKQGETVAVGQPIARVEPAGEQGEAAARTGAKGQTQIQELTRLQQNVARRVAESKATAPDYTLAVDVDMTLAVELRSRLEDAPDPPPTTSDLVVKAVANALREHPRVNGAYRDGRFELYSRVNVGITIPAQDAFAIPTVFDADRKSLGQIARDVHELAERARAGKLAAPELAGGTFTVSDLGVYGIDEFTAVINPPQAAILTIGALKKRPAVDDNGRLVAREQMRISLTSDQRILHGADAAQFLAHVRDLLEQPLNLAL